MRADRLGRLGRAADPPAQLDAVGDLEPGVLARLLHQPHDLADEPGQAQLVRQLEVERHRVRAGRRHRPARARRLGDDDLVAADRQRLAVDLDGRRAGAVGGHERDRVGRGLRWRRATLLGALAEASPELAEVRLDRQLDQLAGVAEIGQRHDVELVADLRPCSSSGSVAQPGAEISACAERLAGLHLRVGPGRPAELDQPAHQRDLLDSSASTSAASACRPGREVHRVDAARSARTAPPTPAR